MIPTDFFFWCGNLMFLHNSPFTDDYKSLSIKLCNETINGNQYSYCASINGQIYYYKYTLSSNVLLKGEFYIETDKWKSKLYSIEKQHNFIRISETPILYYDIYFYSETNMILFGINRCSKIAISTTSSTYKDNVYIVKYMQIPVVKNTQNYTENVIRDIFCISGAVDYIKTTLSDIISYESDNTTLVSYYNHPIQILGIDQVIGHKHNQFSIQVINSFFDQRVSIVKNDRSYSVTETVKRYTDTVTKRTYSMQIDHDIILINPTGLKFVYKSGNNTVTFTRI